MSCSHFEANDNSINQEESSSDELENDDELNDSAPTSTVFFDADANIDEGEPFDYFDAMEVLYFESLLKKTKMPPLQKLKRDLQQNMQHKQQRLRKRAMQQRAQLEQSLHKRKRQIRQHMTQPDFVMTIDKVSFVMGILIIMVTEFVLLMAPQKMGLLYTVLLFPLMMLRYLVYRMDKMHYFMYDFCYFIQVLVLINLYKYPDSQTLLKITFALTNGPLAVAVIMWRNSLVFHSMDKMTSSFIHMLPPLVTFCKRWQDELLQRQFPMWVQSDDTTSSVLIDFYLRPFGLYVLWQALYLFKTEVYSKRKLQYNTELMTSLRWMTRNPTSASYRIINRFGEQHQLTAFCMYQGIYTLVTILGVPLLWRSMQLHALYLCTIFVVALVNGAAYYFHVFAVRYIDKIGKGDDGNKIEKKKEPKGHDGGGEVKEWNSSEAGVSSHTDGSSSKEN